MAKDRQKQERKKIAHVRVCRGCGQLRLFPLRRRFYCGPECALNAQRKNSREFNRIYYQTPEGKAKLTKWQKAHPEAIKAIYRRYHLKHLGERRAKGRRYYWDVTKPRRLKERGGEKL